MTAMQKKPTSPIDHLTAADIEAIGVELDAIRADVLASRGEQDAAYIRKVIAAQRTLEMASRVVLLGSLFPPAWAVGNGWADDREGPGEHGDRPQHHARAVGLDARSQDPLHDVGVG